MIKIKLNIGSVNQNVHYVNISEQLRVDEKNTIVSLIMENNKLKEVNKMLEKSNAGLVVSEFNNETYMATDFPAVVKTGVYTIAVVPFLLTHKELKNKRVITLTTDNHKVKWLLENKYIKVFNINKVLLKNNLWLFGVEIEMLNLQNNKKENEIDLIVKSVDEYVADYGYNDSRVIINYILEKQEKLSNVVREQLETLVLVLNSFNDPYVGIDLHDGNYGYNTKGELIILDPIHSEKSRANKISNDVDISIF